jgi:hypothetical protein
VSSASNAASVVACAAVVGATNDWLANSSVFFDMLLFKGTAVSGNESRQSSPRLRRVQRDPSRAAQRLPLPGGWRRSLRKRSWWGSKQQKALANETSAERHYLSSTARAVGADFAAAAAAQRTAAPAADSSAPRRYIVSGTVVEATAARRLVASTVSSPRSKTNSLNFVAQRQHWRRLLRSPPVSS